MDHQRALVRFGRQRGHREARGGRAHQHQLPHVACGPEPLGRAAGHEGPEGKTGDRQPAFGRELADDMQHVLELAAPFIVNAFAGPHPAEVEAHGRPSAGHEGTRQGLHDLVVHRAAEQRVRMGDHRDAARFARRQIALHLDHARGALEADFFGLGVHGAGVGWAGDAGNVHGTSTGSAGKFSGRRRAAAAAARRPGRSSGATRRSRRCPRRPRRCTRPPRGRPPPRARPRSGRGSRPC
ncbi:hypothetical protein D9M68_709810 [compost metagenome]